jgi:hypothetical protein
MTAGSQGDIEKFLEALFPDEDGERLCISRDLCLVLWRPQPKGSGLSRVRWIRNNSPSAVSSAILDWSKDGDVFFHVCLHSEALREEECRAAERKFSPDFTRGSKSSASCAPGLWIDIDYGDAGHQGKSNPPSLTDATEILSAMPAKPSIVVKTGGGIHAYWVFHDPIELSSPDTRERLRSAVWRWQKMARHIASGRGWNTGVDHTADLSRVLRVPGTNNYKPEYVRKNSGRPSPVEIISHNSDQRYSLEDLEQFMDMTEEVPRDIGASNATLPSGAGFEYNCELPRKCQALLIPGGVAYDQDFASCWAMDEKWAKRQKFEDVSPSGYHMSLARRMHSFGFEQQEVIDSLSYWRREVVGTPAADTQRKISYAIAALNSEVSERQAQSATQNLQIMSQNLEQVKVSGPMQYAMAVEDCREEMLDSLNQSLGRDLGIERVLRFKSQFGDDEYHMVMRDGSKVKIGGTTQILSSGGFKRAIAQATHVVIRDFKPKAWNSIAETILRLAQDVESSSRLEVLTDLLLAFIMDAIRGDSDKYRLARNHLPFAHEWRRGSSVATIGAGETRICVPPRSFVTWLSGNPQRPEGMSSAQISQHLHAEDIWTQPIVVNIGVDPDRPDSNPITVRCHIVSGAISSDILGLLEDRKRMREQALMRVEDDSDDE